MSLISLLLSHFSTFKGDFARGASRAPALGRPPRWWRRSRTRRPSARRTRKAAWAPAATLRSRRRSGGSPRRYLARWLGEARPEHWEIPCTPRKKIWNTGGFPRKMFYFYGGFSTSMFVDRKVTCKMIEKYACRGKGFGALT